MRRNGNPNLVLAKSKGAVTVESSVEGPQKTKIELANDTAILLLGIYL